MKQLLDWIVSSPPATTITALAALLTAYRWQSNREHKKTLTVIQGVGKQINGGLLSRIERIEKALGIRTDDGGQSE